MIFLKEKNEKLVLLLFISLILFKTTNNLKQC